MVVKHITNNYLGYLLISLCFKSKLNSINEMEDKINKKSMKVHNLIFPIWFLILIPIIWIFILSANFFMG